MSSRKEQKILINELIPMVKEFKKSLPDYEKQKEDVFSKIDELENELADMDVQDDFNADGLKASIIVNVLDSERQELEDKINDLVDGVEEYKDEISGSTAARMEDKLSEADDLFDYLNFDDCTSIDEISSKLDELIEHLENLL